MENIKKSKNEEMNKKCSKNESKKQEKRQKTGEKKSRKKRKRGPKGAHHPRWAPKLIFHIRTVKRNRNEIEAQKKSDFEHPIKTKKMKENERT